MKKTILFSAWLLCIVDSFSQEVIVSNPRRTKFYAGIKNPLAVMVEGYSCKSIILKPDNGSFEKNGCYHTFAPARFGIANVQVMVRQGKTVKKIKVVTLYVDSFPPPVAWVGGRNHGKFIKGALQVQAGIGAGADPALGFELHFEVKSFTVIIARKDSILFCHSITGNIFTPEIKARFAQLQSGDTVIFSKIICKMAGGYEQAAKPLEFDIE